MTGSLNNVLQNRLFHDVSLQLLVTLFANAMNMFIIWSTITICYGNSQQLSGTKWNPGKCLCEQKVSSTLVATVSYLMETSLYGKLMVLHIILMLNILLSDICLGIIVLCVGFYLHILC